MQDPNGMLMSEPASVQQVPYLQYYLQPRIAYFKKKCDCIIFDLGPYPIVLRGYSQIFAHGIPLEVFHGPGHSRDGTEVFYMQGRCAHLLSSLSSPWLHHCMVTVASLLYTKFTLLLLPSKLSSAWSPSIFTFFYHRFYLCISKLWWIFVKGGHYSVV